MYKSIVVKSQLLGAICRTKFHIISKLINLSAFTFNQQLSKIFQVFLFSIQKMDFILDIVNSIWLFHELFLTLNQTFLDLNMPTVKAIYWMENGKTRHIWIVKKIWMLVFFSIHLCMIQTKLFWKKNYWKYDDGGYVIRFCLQ